MDIRRKEIYFDLLKQMEENPNLQEMKKYPQHGTNNCFQHSHNVAVYSFFLAVRNAREHFILDRKTENIINSHMWPLPFSEMPKSREAVLVNLSDKFCAYQEMNRGMRSIEQMSGKSIFLQSVDGREKKF